MRKLAILLLSLAAVGAAPPDPAAPQPAAPSRPAAEAPPLPGEEGFAVDFGEDRHERMTVPVSIGARGPYRFIVDTGAERTVIARELASTLQLIASGKARLHSMTEVSDIQTVAIPALEVGGKEVRGIQAPALERRNLGAEGMLGVDSLQAQRVSFDFDRQQMTVVPSRKHEESWTQDAIVVRAQNRFGHLVLVDASVEGQKVWVIVDTGAQATVGNGALLRKLQKKGKLKSLAAVEMISVTGGRLTADQSLVKHIRLGGVDIYDLPVAFADVHPFKQLGLTDRPAILLGMDALRLFERVSVDFANRRVRLLAPGRSERAPSTQSALASVPKSGA
ncbi:MAG: aspartyl protease family protein [Alphaproteobacteria bacterium]|nr:aspartyl protease family protein [Alphaproteobacteria bacterium]MBV9370655.1 aspartyl protease family protein [Alphaproteobacteria bacterium]MBV9899981.1 aspartyl protease family protein [Alphaproteobacteria bacterium]